MVAKVDCERPAEPIDGVSHPLAVVRAFALRQAMLEAHYRLMATGLAPADDGTLQGPPRLSPKDRDTADHNRDGDTWPTE